jgi:hypothetical protein
MFGGSWTTWLRSRPTLPAAVPAATLTDIRSQILGALADCHGASADRVRNLVRSTRSGSDLLLLRGDIYQLVACAHCEAEARRRLNELLPILEGWVPSGSVSRF